MGWKPKTIAGKILKGATIAGGSVLGLAVGTSIVGKAGGIVKTAVNAVKNRKTAKGTTVLSNAGATVTSGIKATVDKVKESAVNLVSGLTAEQREILKQERQQTRAEEQKLKLIDKLIRAGATPAEARAKAGLDPEELVSYDGAPVQSAGFGDLLQNKNILIALGAIAALFMLTKKR